MLDLLILLFAVWCVWWYKVTRLPENFPPGPRFPLPVVGSLYALGSDMYKGFKDFHKKYGDIFGLHMGSRKVVVLSSYELIQEACTKNILSGRPPLKIWEQMREGASLSGDIPGATPVLLFL